ncbi:MAG TPA: 2-amino-4-hydroxy-6-hydroxymethyldihydropteridine diphosphokinase [Candidatus Diapherotrites archaeon]|uniref:2-amino-4-hydroxy-6-hydroxymethyldihydropteridine diphosphokinase n=1 Tax=Candidatus Iainarchaeum sp. TaxID=3101447 RepID=A0A7J4IYX9_9ARCH|nr:2-amino-4-hydroxy-6-hydroxymethyldihydropteridine diphosphokinase [Candidatus Diapherotrites archaeon]
MNTALISVGSNISKKANIFASIAALNAQFPSISFSPVFETPFVGDGRQENYYNYCAKIITSLPAKKLKKLFRGLERQYGRERAGRKDAPRTLDIDLLAFNGLKDRPQNTTCRGFEKLAYVLVPLSRIEPDFIVPGTGKSVGLLLAKIPAKEKRQIRKVILSAKVEDISVEKRKAESGNAERPHHYALVALSADGFLARHHGHRSDWTSREDKEFLHKMEDQSDAIVLTRSSYENARKWLSERKCIVLTRRVGGIKKESEFLTYINPEKADLNRFFSQSGLREVCNLGGPVAYTILLEKGLLDDLYITIEPIAFGAGLALFSKKMPDLHLQPVSFRKLNKKGTVLLHYKVRKQNKWIE